jgi:hypothetical protein
MKPGTPSYVFVVDNNDEASAGTRIVWDSTDIDTSVIDTVGSIIKDKTEVVIDNSDTSTSSDGLWSVSSYYPGYYGDNYLYSANTDGEWFEWRTDEIGEDSYEVFARWTSVVGRPTDVEYHIYNNDELLGSISMDQTQNCDSSWCSLGVYKFTNQARIRVYSSDSGTEGTCADAIKMIVNTTNIVSNHKQITSVSAGRLQKAQPSTIMYDLRGRRFKNVSSSFKGRKSGVYIIPGLDIKKVVF